MTTTDAPAPALPLRIGIVGCGNIAGPYARFIAEKPELRLAAATDLDLARAETLTAEHGGRAVGSLDEVIAESDIVVNLTVQPQHYPVTKAALEAGRHVHSEKPLAITSAQAHELVAIARERGVRLAASPFTLLGEAQQTAWKLVREGRIGRVRAVFAEVSWGRIETWHPAPEPFYEVGPLVDVGVYPLSIITAILGPVRKVTAFGRVLMPDRVTKDGRPFHVATPDFSVSLLELEGGAVVRLTTSFAIGQQAKRQAAIEFHGDDGSVHLGHFFRFDSPVELAGFGDQQPYVDVPLVREAPGQIDWGRGLVDLAEAIVEDRPHRATGEQAAHIVDVLVAAHRSMREERPVEITSAFPQPGPMPWAE